MNHVLPKLRCQARVPMLINLQQWNLCRCKLRQADLSAQRNSLADLKDYVTEFGDDANDQVKSSLDYTDYCCRISEFPQSYPEAMELPESERWKATMNDIHTDHVARRSRVSAGDVGYLLSKKVPMVPRPTRPGM